MSIHGLVERLLFLFLAVLVSSAVVAAECPSEIEAVTALDPIVPEEVLTYRVKPLTRCELEAEAEAWQILLQDKLREISDAEVASFYKKDQITKTEKAEAALKELSDAQQKDPESADKALEEAKKLSEEARDAEAREAGDAAVQEAVQAAKKQAEQEGEVVAASDETTEAKSQVRTALLQRITDLKAERTALIDRFEIVLAELQKKGGDVSEYESYINAVSGIEVDVTDAGATWTTITGWLSSEEGGLRWAINIVQFLLILIVSYAVSGLVGKALRRALANTSRISSLLRDFIVVSCRRLVLFIGFFVGLSALEINVGPVLAVVGAAGFVIAFALQNSLSNFASGILMMIFRPFDVEDVVSVAGVVGTVESMNLLSTQLRTPDNKLVVVSNNSVWGDVITNITGKDRRRVDLVFGIGYGDDIEKAQTILETILNEHEMVLEDPKPTIKLHELGDSSVNFVCRPWTRTENYWDVYWDVTREVKRRFDAEGVSIPFPQRDVHIYQETQGA